MTFKLGTILFLLAVTTGCKTNELSKIKASDVDKNEIFGKWIWIGSTGGHAGRMEDPDKTGKSQTLELNKDGSFKKFTNLKLATQGKYKIAKGKSVTSTTETFYQISYVPRSVKQSILKAKNDTLILSDEVYNGYTSAYVRQK